MTEARRGPAAAESAAAAREPVTEPVGHGPPGDRADGPSADRAAAAPPEPDDGARPDDTDAESSGLDGAQLLAEALGAQVIEEIPHQ